jgi:hypothetical protein
VDEVRSSLPHPKAREVAITALARPDRIERSGVIVEAGKIVDEDRITVDPCDDSRCSTTFR